METDSEARQHRRRVFVLSSAVLVSVCAILCETIYLNRPPRAPASVAHWGEVSRRGELKSGDTAPEIHLKMPDGTREIGPRDLHGNKPVVLLFGSYTCPNFRSHSAPFGQLASQYANKAEFFVVYIREAHPDESGQIPENKHLGPLPAATSFEERAKAAAKCAAVLNLNVPVLVDGLDNRAATDYRAWPERVYILDGNGKIAYTGTAPGHVNFAEIDAALQSILRKTSRAIDSA